MSHQLPCPPLCLSDLNSAELKGRVVLLRADLNVPLDDAGRVTDDTRIREAVASIEYLAERGARVLLCSHLGRPKGVDEKLSLSVVRPRLQELLGKEVDHVDDCIGPAVAKKVSFLRNGEILLLENTRFHAGECKNDLGFASQLAAHADLFVNDAFGCAHRVHASTAGVARFLQPAVAGLLMNKELDFLCKAVNNPSRPFTAIVGGSKVSSKIGVLKSLIGKCDKLLIGGGMVFTFLAARGLPVGSSLVEANKLDMARQLEEEAAARGVQLLLPSDIVVADGFFANADSRVTGADDIPDGWMGLDIGPATIQAFTEALSDCRTVLWNGPMGVFEFDKFSHGTTAIANAVAALTPKGAITIIGGGDSVCAVEKAGVAHRMSHISTGGGASLELLEGRTLPCVAALTPSSAQLPTARLPDAVLPSATVLLAQYAYHLVCNAMYSVLAALLHREAAVAHTVVDGVSAKEGSARGRTLPRSSSRPHLATL